MKAWSLFVCGALVLAAGLYAMSREVRQLEHERALALATAEHEEKIRLTLWELENQMLPILIRESSRDPEARVDTSDVIDNNVVANFHVAPTGSNTLTANPRNAAKIGQDDAQYFAEEDRGINKALGSLPQAREPKGQSEETPSQSGRVQTADVQGYDWQEQTAYGGKEPTKAQQLKQKAYNDANLQNRYSQKEIQENVWNLSNGMRYGKNLSVGPLKSVWADGRLLMARRIDAKTGTSFQGVWLDWDGLRDELTATARQYLPEARLEPVDNLEDSEANTDPRRLAALPARLVPGDVPPVRFAGWTTTDQALTAMWLAYGVVLVGGAFFMRSLLALSQRRADFVSAVSHELRTPLTTFRMSTDLLARDDLPEEMRKRHRSSLRREAERLGHLVENVLAYARLEKGRDESRFADIRVGDLLERIREPLETRAAEAGLKVVIGETTDDVLKLPLHIDPAAVERILYNLVDNACKYGREGQSDELHLIPSRSGDLALIKVRDHGPGIENPKRIFKPFRKSAREAALSAPGVGLGLALCRRLARRMRGDLSLDTSVRDGACFVLSLPTA